MHSAEFLRGAVAGMQMAGIDSPSREALVYQAKQQLAEAEAREAGDKCPRCGSPDPALHPAMQFEGEVQPCGDNWHRGQAREAGEPSLADQLAAAQAEVARLSTRVDALEDALEDAMNPQDVASVDSGLREAGDQLAAAQAEAKERTTMAARAQEAMRYLLNGLPATDAIWAAYGNADSARAWLADRDARMKALGAAEWLEDRIGVMKEAGFQRDTYDRSWFANQAAQLRKQAEAARLAEGE